MKKITLVGSSIFQHWSIVVNLLPNYNITNRAIGGTITSYWVDNIKSVLIDESPDVVLYYAGSNDISENISPDEILSNVQVCRKIISDKSPSIKFAYFGIMKAPQKEGKGDIIERLNNNISLMLKPEDIFIDSNKIFFIDGIPVTRFYIEDGLHLTKEAYESLSDYSAPIIKKWLNKDIVDPARD